MVKGGAKVALCMQHSNGMQWVLAFIPHCVNSIQCDESRSVSARASTGTFFAHTNHVAIQHMLRVIAVKDRVP